MKMSDGATYSSSCTRKHSSQTQTCSGKNASMALASSAGTKLSHSGDMPRSTKVWESGWSQNRQRA